MKRRAELNALQYQIRPHFIYNMLNSIRFAAMIAGAKIELLQVSTNREGEFLKAMDSEHWLSVRSGMIEAAQKYNMRLIVITAENETIFAEQNKIISDF